MGALLTQNFRYFVRRPQSLPTQTLQFSRKYRTNMTYVQSQNTHIFPHICHSQKFNSMRVISTFCFVSEKVFWKKLTLILSLEAALKHLFASIKYYITFHRDCPPSQRHDAVPAARQAAQHGEATHLPPQVAVAQRLLQLLGLCPQGTCTQALK